MAHSKRCQEKFSQYKIEGQSKPFIDSNLQFQLPGPEREFSHSTTHTCSPIYSHYMGTCPFASPISAEVNEAEFYRAMQEAELSYEAWKHMQQQLQKFVQIKN